MLGKLLKRDILSQMKLHFGVYLMFAIVSVASFAFLKLNDNYPNSMLVKIGLGISIFAFILLFIGIYFVTFILSIMRYRNNLLKDEGYLMHTLPVTAAQLHFSKMLASIVWYIGDIIASAAAITILTGSFKWIRYVIEMFMISVGYASDKFILASVFPETIGAEAPTAFTYVLVIGGVIILVFLSLFQSLSMIYTSLCIGYSTYGNKDIMSFAAYLIINVILQILSTIGVVIVGIVQLSSIDALMNESVAQPKELFAAIMIFTMILAVVTGVILNIISIKITEKKLNLE